MTIELNHQELNILLYVLDESRTTLAVEQTTAPSCVDSCPIVDHLEEMFDNLTPAKKIINHLNNHLREGMLECGFLELADVLHAGGKHLAPADHARLEQVNARLQQWHCEIHLTPEEGQILRAALKRLPRSAWVTMPRTLWRLRKKLRAT